MSALSAAEPTRLFEDADGSGVRVCILDTGVEDGHPMIGAIETAMRVTTGRSGELTVEPTEATDLVGHGTACAGVIRSIAPRCSITSVQVLTLGKAGTGQVLLAGLRWALSQGYDVINMSLSASKPAIRDELAGMCDQAYFQRSILCAAMHNNGMPSYPWTFASVISVASMERRVADGASRQFPQVHYSDQPPAEFLAPGIGVRVAWTSGSTIKSTGNSIAAPYVSGLCALLLSKYPGLTPFEVKTILYRTSINSLPHID
jgi:subtilisin